MGIWSRLGTVISSYLNDLETESEKKIPGRRTRYSSAGDPDLDSAFDELNDYLNGKERPAADNYNNIKPPPENLRPDFAVLGVPFGAPAEECKAAYKKLLKIHHPDRHAGHESNFKKATERSARINASWDRIAKWHQEK